MVDADLQSSSMPWTTAIAVFKLDMRNSLAYAAAFSFQWIQIIFQVMMAYLLSLVINPSAKFGYGGYAGSYFSYLLVSFAFVSFQTTAIGSFSEWVREAQTIGVLEAMLATSTRLGSIILATGLWSFGLTTVKVLFYVLLGLLFGLDLHHVNALTAFVFLILTVASVSPIGLLAAAMTMVFKKTGPITQALQGLTNIFGGIYVPLSRLPVPMQIAGTLLPITHALNGFHGALYGATLYDLRVEVYWLLGSTAVLLPVSLLAFSRAVHAARVDGTLGQY
jgi:ABC-2 type transport system permease protein